MRKIGLATTHILSADGAPTALGRTLAAYFAYRARVLNTFVEPRLMNAHQAKALFYDPHELTTVTVNDAPLHTFARRVDGAFPG